MTAKVSEDISNDLKDAIIQQIKQSNHAYYHVLTFEDINSVLIDILHENNQHDPKELFKKQ